MNAPLDVAGVRISSHAIKRFRERTGARYGGGKAVKRLRTMLARAQEMILKPEFRVVALIDHGVRPARYFQHEGYILVVEDGVLKTIHEGTAGRWEVAA